MSLSFEHRPSDSPFIEKVWRSHSEAAGRFTSIAANHFELVVSRLNGKSLLTLRGPETKSSPADCPADGAWLGIRFKLGAFMPFLPPGQLINRNDVNLPGASSKAFWLNGSAWEYPDFENAETFVKRLVHKGILVRDYTIEGALQRCPPRTSLRSTQRHFLLATGLTQSSIRQIERARHATNLLQQGLSILDTVHEAGYFDQAHLTRALKLRIGQTPLEIVQAREQLSFLYKTKPLP